MPTLAWFLFEAGGGGFLVHLFWNIAQRRDIDEKLIKKDKKVREPYLALLALVTKHVCLLPKPVKLSFWQSQFFPPRRKLFGEGARISVQSDDNLSFWELAIELQERVQAAADTGRLAAGSRATSRRPRWRWEDNSVRILCFLSPKKFCAQPVLNISPKQKFE